MSNDHKRAQRIRQLCVHGWTDDGRCPSCLFAPNEDAWAVVAVVMRSPLHRRTWLGSLLCPGPWEFDYLAGPLRRVKRVMQARLDAPVWRWHRHDPGMWVLQIPQDGSE